MKAIIFFLILALSIGAAFITWRVTQQEEKKPEVQVVVQPQIVEKEVPTVEVVVARGDIPIGSAIKADMLDKRAWPSNLVVTGDAGFVLAEAMDAEVIGRVSRSTLRAGEPIIKSLLANPSDPSFLAAALKEGMRAITIQIDGISGVAGFIYPGDTVDVLITHEITLPGSQINEQGKIVPNPPQSVTEVLVSNVRVMAIDQRYTAAAGQAPTPGSSATVEVTPINAQKIKLAETKGRLSLALKAIRRADAKSGVAKKKESLPRPIGKGDLSRVTPPSIFPVLYEGGDRVVPRTVQLAAAPVEEMEAEIAKEQAAAGSGQVARADGAEDDGQEEITTPEELKSMGVEAESSAASVVVIRGIERETVGAMGAK